MAERAEDTPQQKFESGVNRALKCGKVFIQGTVVSSPQDAAKQVKTANQNEAEWLGVLFPSLKMTVSSEASAGKKISDLLASLSNTPEGN